MRVALTMVVAVLAVLAEPVLGETQPLTGTAVTTSKNGLDGSAIVDGAFSLGSTSVAIFNDNNDNYIEAGAANPWVQIDFGEGNQATIGDVDVYGNLENQQTPFSCMMAMLLSQVDGLGYVPYQAARGQDAEVPAVCGRGLTAGGVTNTPNTGVIVGVSDSSCTNAGCLTLDASGDPDGADTTACTGRSGAKRLILPTDVGYADGAGGPPPGDGKFTVNCGTKVGRYLYVQLVGLQRQLWVGEIKAHVTAAPATPAPETPAPAPAASCTAGTQYVSNNQCVDCPSESTSSGTDATFCTSVQPLRQKWQQWT